MAKYAFTAKPIEGFEQRNPKYWAVATPPKDATEVAVDEAFPEIAAHFKAQEGVTVKVIKAPKAEKAE